MEYIIVAFRSRQHTMRFYQFLKSNNVYAEMVNTPKEAGVGCGLSVKIDKSYFGIVKRAVKIASLSSFAGYFHITEEGGRRRVRTI